MIQLNARQLELLGQPVINAFHCVQIGNMRFTSYPSDLVLGGQMYLTSNVLFAIEHPRMTSVVDRDLYKIVLTDSAFSFGSIYEQSLIGAAASVRLGLVDYNTNEPDVNNTFIIYKGIIQGFDYEIDTAEKGEVTSTITCSNPMADLDAVKPFYTTKDFIRQLNPEDSSFDQIYHGAGSVNLNWGKA
jgi:hypothetical protein